MAPPRFNPLPSPRPPHIDPHPTPLEMPATRGDVRSENNKSTNGQSKVLLGVMGAIVAIVGSATTVTTTYINRSAVHEETKPAVEQTAAVHEKQKEFEQQLGETKRLDKEAHERIEQHLNHLDDQQGKLLEAVLKGRR